MQATLIGPTRDEYCLLRVCCTGKGGQVGR